MRKKPLQIVVLTGGAAVSILPIVTIGSLYVAFGTWAFVTRHYSVAARTVCR